MIRRKKTFGFGFAQEVAKVNFKNAHFKKPLIEDWKDALIPNYDGTIRHDLQSSVWRITLFYIVIVFIFFVLFIRLFHLQVVNGKENRSLADGNRIQIKRIHAPRGVIFDRNGKVLAANSPGFRLTDPQNKKTIFVSREESLEMEVKNDPRVLYLEVDNIRKYPFGEKIAHVLGYVGEISSEQLQMPEYDSYSQGDRMGISGVEAFYESILRGTDGGEIIEVDAGGKRLRTLRTVPAVPGQNVYLTIDMDLQEQTYTKLSEAVQSSKSCCGAAVAQNPQNGEVLALVSLPSFDNNVFTNIQKSDAAVEILSNQNSPILNRVISGTYPPGSTYKIVSSLAALTSGKVTPETTIEDTGQVNLGEFKFTNWFFTQHGRTDGQVDVVKALKRSNDTYYYLIGQRIGEKVLIEWSRKLRLGGKLGIDLGGEATGLVPDNAWKMANFDTPWYPGDTLHMSIGQGFLLTTPLQVLGFTSFIAADGDLYRPQLFLKSTLEDDYVVKTYKPEVLVSDVASKDQLDPIKQGLEEVPKVGGTAWPFLNFPFPTAGKTGTAEFGHPDDKTHAWYTSYAPLDEPKIAMTVLIEAGGEGSSVASPVVKEVLRWYLSEDKTNLVPDTNQSASESARILGE